MNNTYTLEQAYAEPDSMAEYKIMMRSMEHDHLFGEKLYPLDGRKTTRYLMDNNIAYGWFPIGLYLNDDYRPFEDFTVEQMEQFVKQDCEQIERKRRAEAENALAEKALAEIWGM